jgi:hypothetical protein
VCRGDYAIQFGNRLEQSLAVAERDAELLEIAFPQQANGLEVESLSAKTCP